jgi:hypothetical protein
MTEAPSDLIVMDPQTGLTCTRSDNEKDPNWLEANEYAKNLSRFEKFRALLAPRHLGLCRTLSKTSASASD